MDKQYKGTEREWFEKNPMPGHMRITMLSESLGTVFLVQQGAALKPVEKREN